MTTTIAENRVKVEPCHSPLIPPSFYTASAQPPHHLAKGFASPWPSATANGGMLSFFRTRIFDWDEKPLPDAGALPAVRHATFIPTNSNKEADVKFTWLGHAACHFQIPIPSASKSKPVTILADPVFSQRVSPSQSIGPKRYTESPTSVKDMAESQDENVWPEILVISHNHYDHLDYDTVKQILAQPNGKIQPHIFCPLGLKVWFKTNFGIKESGITELDWWQDRVAALEGNRRIRLTCVPAQHFTGRSPFDRNQTLWAGWTFKALGEDDEGSSEGKNVYFAGDTGYRTVPRGATREDEDKLPHCPAFEEIGEKLGPFDVAAIPIGAYEPRPFMSTVHMNPRDAVCVHQQVKSKKSIGIHWGSFRLTPEDVNEPPKKLKEEMKVAGFDEDDFTVMGIGETRTF